MPHIYPGYRECGSGQFGPVGRAGSSRPRLRPAESSHRTALCKGSLCTCADSNVPFRRLNLAAKRASGSPENRFTISRNLEPATAYLRDRKFLYSTQGNNLTIELDEHAIAQFIADLGDLKVMYSHISIDKPTLEDYFLSIAK